MFVLAVCIKNKVCCIT